MLLTYTFPSFEEAILNGTKIHTLRADPTRRWKPGMSIQHWMGSPRNPHAKVKPRQFATGECKSVQEVSAIILYGAMQDYVEISVDGRTLHPDEAMQLIRNDGLTVGEFIQFFGESGVHRCDLKLRLIHFTDFKY